MHNDFSKVVFSTVSRKLGLKSTNTDHIYTDRKGCLWLFLQHESDKTFDLYNDDEEKNISLSYVFSDEESARLSTINKLILEGV